MSGKTGHVKNIHTDEVTGYGQLEINSMGINDRRKYFILAPFGTAYNPPINTRVLTIPSENNDFNFSIGVLNKITSEGLGKGDRAIFSTSEDGSEIKSFIKFRNDGTMEQNGDSDFLAGYTKLKEGFDQLLSDHNDLVTAFNTHMHATAATGPPVIPTPGSGIPATPSTASIDSSKKDNLKCE